MHDTLGETSLVRPVTGALYDNATIFGGRLRVAAFGRFYNSAKQEEDWTFSNLRKPEDAKEKNSSLTRNLPVIAKEMGFTELLVPSPVDFNASICWQEDLSVRIPLGGRLTVKRGINADGCRLQPGQAYGLSAAGCAAIAACYPFDPLLHEKVRVAAGHAGLKSCVDEQAAQTGLISRKPESVTEALLDSMNCSGGRKYRRKRVGIVIIFPISSSELKYSWDYPGSGEENELRCKYIAEKFGKGCVPGVEKEGQIELHEIITKQFVDLGVPIENINLILTKDLFWKTNWRDGKEIWYSTRGDFPKRRNLILIKHNRVTPPKP